MQKSQIPTKFPIPFANSAVNITFPIPTNYTGTPGSASLNLGFPAETIAPIGGGGYQPFGKDFNGIFYWTSLITQWQEAGAGYTFDGTFSTAIGGYPKNSALVSTLYPGNYWLSIADNNTSNPDTTFNSSNWIPFPGIIDNSYNFTVYGTGQFSSLTSAFNYLSAFKIAQNGLVNLSLSSGTFTETPFIMDHPNADRIYITGGTGAIQSAGSGTIQSWFTVTGSAAANRSANSTSTLTSLRSNYGTEIDVTVGSGSGIIIATPGLLISNILFFGKDVPSNNVPLIDIRALLTASNISLVSSGSGAIGNGIGIKVTGNGASILNQGLLSATGFGSTGIAIDNGGSLSFSGNSFQSIVQMICTTSNGDSGIRANNNGDLGGPTISYVSNGQFISRGNAGNGAWASNGGKISIKLSTDNSIGAPIFSTNGSAGVFAGNKGNITIGNAVIQSNGGNGILAQEGSVISASSPTISGNVSTAILAQSGSFVDATGAAVTSSPAANTVGNNNSYVAQ